MINKHAHMNNTVIFTRSSPDMIHKHGHMNNTVTFTRC